MEERYERPLKPQLSPVLTLFRQAVLQDRGLQDRLREADSCEAVARIANEYLRQHVRLEVSSEIEKTPLRGLAEDTFRDMFQITVDDLQQHILYQANDRGEVLLGESEMAMVAGSTALAGGTGCYGCTCGNTCALAKTC